MRKILIFEMITADGFFAGPKGEIDWHVVDEEFNTFAINQLDSVDLLLFGRVTYEVMASYWPTSAALTDDPIVAGKMNATPKIVFSKTLARADWNNTKLMRDIDPQAIQKMKQQPGKDMVIFGSGAIVTAFTDLGLIDEYRLLVNPVVLGKGISLFKDLQDRHALKLVKAQAFNSGNVLLIYQPGKP